MPGSNPSREPSNFSDLANVADRRLFSIADITVRPKRSANRVILCTVFDRDIFTFKQTATSNSSKRQRLLANRREAVASNPHPPITDIIVRRPKRR
jgi:hypothetical protein